MGAATYWTRARLKRQGFSIVLLAVLVGLGAGAALAAAAGARRSSSALDRFEAHSHPPDGIASAEDEDALDEIVALDGIVDHDRFFLAGLLPAGRPCGSTSADFFPLAVTTTDPYRLEAPLVLDGRLPRQGQPGEIALPAVIAARLGLGVGDVLQLGEPDPATPYEELCDGRHVPEFPRTHDFEVTGITRTPQEVGARLEDFTVTYFTTTFAETTPDVPDISGPVARVVIAPGTDTEALLEAADRLGGEIELSTGGVDVKAGVEAVANGLWLVAGAVALATVAGLTFGLSRLHSAAVEHLRVLRALGLGRRGRFLAIATLSAPVVVAAAAVAVTVAAILSPLHPIGLARQAEIDPGFAIDAAAFAAGATAVLLVGTLLVTVVAHRASRPPVAAGHSTARQPRAITAALPPPVAVGVGYATSGSRSGPIPGRAAIACTVVAVGAIVAVLLFGTSLDATVADPERYGWGDFDAGVSLGGGEEELSGDPEQTVITRLREDPDAAVATVYDRREVLLDGSVTTGAFLDAHQGRAGFTLVAGRHPSGANEIGLGTETADALDVSVGDHVDLAPLDSEAVPITLEVVGLEAFPASEDSLPLAEGFIADIAVADASGVDLFCAEFETCSSQTLVGFADGVDADTARAELAAEGYEVIAPNAGAEVRRLEGVADLPEAVATAFAVLAVLAMLYVLATTPDRAGRELATLAALGFRPRQLRQVLRTEGMTIGALGAAIGVVVGVVGGRVAWSRVAEGVGVPPTPVVEISLVAAVLAGAVLLGAALASLPARRRGRLGRATALGRELS